MSIKQLSDKAKLSYAHTNKVLNGIKTLKLDILEKIAVQGLGLPTEYFIETEIENGLKVRSTKAKPLMSEILLGVIDVLRLVEQQDVDRLRRFFITEPQRPLIATGQGGKFAVASYAALLYGTCQSLGRAVTCYSCNSLSDATIKNSKILLVSKGMANIDINYIAKRCMELNPSYTCAVRTCGEKEKNDLAKELDKKCGYSFKYDINLLDGFISIQSVFALMSLFYKSFTNDNNFVSKLNLSKDPQENYTYTSANGISLIPSLSKIRHFTVLYGSYGEPIAYNIESNIVEGGIASCMISDYKNYTHGRFLCEGNYIKSKYHPQTEAALICVVTPREQHIYEDLIAELPSHLPIITIRTNLITPLATIDLLYKANMFVAHLGEHYFKTNPNNPNNYSGIDKRVPKNGVDFKADFNIYGALDAEVEKVTIKKLRQKLKIEVETLTDLFKIRDEILKKEAERTIQAREIWQKTKPLSWEDFAFRQTHTYDTTKLECWSFNSRTDVRNGVPLKLGNMGNDFGVKILGIDFANSEVPYQLAIFDNSTESVKIQEEIINPQNEWLTNGLKMKRKFIYNESAMDGYYKFRRDTEFENGKQFWCYEWMKWIVWEKVKQNKGFREILLAIPKNAVIIEQAQRRSKTMWGAWNEELLHERSIVIRAAEIENGLGKTSKAVKDFAYAVNNVGTWIGENAMGQILTMAKLALNEGIEMPIDETILNKAKINWFGQVLQFTKDNDGKITVKAIPIRWLV